jgi:hypothetical protein
VLANMAKVLVEENATTAIDQADYRTRYEALEKNIRLSRQILITFFQKEIEN